MLRRNNPRFAELDFSVALEPQATKRDNFPGFRDPAGIVGRPSNQQRR
jgi:hypothetical protein